eukprot:27271_1
MTDISVPTQQSIALSILQQEANNEAGSNFSSNDKTFKASDISAITFNKFFGGLGKLSDAKCIQRRPRFIAYTIIVMGIGTLDIYIVSYAPLSVILALIPLFILIAAFYIDIISPRLCGKQYYKKKTTDVDAWKMTHLDTQLQVKNTYSNAICWLFDAPNDFGIYNDKIWVLFFVIYFVTFIGSLVVHLTFPGSVVYMCFPAERETLPVVQDGRCIIAYEWTLTMNLVAFGSLMFCLISSIGVQKGCVEDIKKAQQTIQTHISYNDNPNTPNYEYLQFIEATRKNSGWATTPMKRFVKYGMFCLISIIFAFHLLWFPNDDTRGFYGPNKNAMYFMYVLCVFIQFSIMVTALVTLISLIGPYKDFYLITTSLGQVAVTDVDNMVAKIGHWWLIRQFYHSYVYVIYYQLSNSLFTTIVMSAFSGVAIVTWWAIRAHFMDTQDEFLTYSTVCVMQLVIMLCLWALIASLYIARVYSYRVQHVKMLNYQMILQKYFRSVDYEEAIDVTNLVCTYITNCDVVPTVFGVSITWEKIYLFIGYVISAIFTIVGVNSNSD